PPSLSSHLSLSIHLPTLANIAVLHRAFVQRGAATLSTFPTLISDRLHRNNVCQSF
ncbi:hypothetical protein LINPERPRIM_LOCUS38368, partial [Linum perenne]